MLQQEGSAKSGLPQSPEEPVSKLVPFSPGVL